MSGNDPVGRRWFLRLQSAYVLALARGIYLVIALGCLLAVFGGLVYVGYLQATTAGQPETVPIPPPYQGTETPVAPSDRTLDLAVIGKRFAPPTNVRFQVASSTWTVPPAEGQVLGYFLADTPNGLASFPEGVSVIGGRDAELFERVPDRASKKNSLAARPVLVEQVAEALRDIKEPTSRTFEIRVVARDRYGIASAPMELSFDLRLAPKPAASTTAAPSAPPAKPTELEAVASEVARIVEPDVNPGHFAAYKTALKAPSRCGASDSDGSFIANYRRALEEVRPRLTAANVEVLYAGLCDAWNEVLRREAAAQERLEQQQRAVQWAAEEARERAQAENDEMQRRHAVQVNEAKQRAQQTMAVVGGALFLFLAVALVLAFLAIEGHSRAVRAAMEAMMQMGQGRATHEPAADQA